MTDDEVVALVEWEVKITGGRLSMLGATDDQIVRAWLAVLRGMEERRAFPILDPAPLDMN